MVQAAATVGAEGRPGCGLTCLISELSDSVKIFIAPGPLEISRQ